LLFAATLRIPGNIAVRHLRGKAEWLEGQVDEAHGWHCEVRRCPGETGGQYKPLDDAGLTQINDNIFRILEEVGFADATPHCIETCTSVGAIMGDDGRLRMPRAVAEKAIEVAARDLVLHGQDPQHDVTLSGQKVHFSTAGAAVMIAESENNLYRESTAQDLYNLARIADSCEHIHIFQRMCVLRDGSRRNISRKRWRCCTSSPVAKTSGARARSSASRIVSWCRR
jgi:trimethylamine:corrinoid methyltransferase-like protein